MANDASEPGCGQWAAIGIGWVALWYLVLSSSYEAATLGLRECGFFEYACNAPWRRANGNFANGMMLAILSIPLPILAWNWIRRQSETRAGKQAERKVRLAEERADREAQQKITQIDEQAKAARSKLDRGEFIQSLGAVTDFLDILPHETARERILQIRQGISKELRDIVATYTMDQMIQILRDDRALNIKLTSMLASFDLAGVVSSDADVLREALRLAGPRGR